MAVYTGIAFPRAALAGNPSDGYRGKTIAFPFNNFRAMVTARASEKFILECGEADLLQHNSFDDFLIHQQNFGIEGGLRLIKASVIMFANWMAEYYPDIIRQNITLSYKTTIPNRVGLAGSSAIIIACLRALAKAHHIILPPEHQAALAYATENSMLGIAAGWQDRLVQAMDVPLYMDFSEDEPEAPHEGVFEPMEIPADMPIHIVYYTTNPQDSNIPHQLFRQKVAEGNPDALNAIEQWKRITDEMKQAITDKDYKKCAALANENHDLRVMHFNILPEYQQLAELIKSTGAGANFTGSGGAAVAINSNEEDLKKAFKNYPVNIIKPIIL